jgi:hypothetical protein
MWSSSHVTAKFCQVLLPSSTSAIILPPPPSAKACPQALYVRIIPIGRFCLYILSVAYYLHYTSTLSTRLGTLGVLVY